MVMKTSQKKRRKPSTFQYFNVLQFAGLLNLISYWMFILSDNHVAFIRARNRLIQSPRFTEIIIFTRLSLSKSQDNHLPHKRLEKQHLPHRSYEVVKYQSPISMETISLYDT